VLRLKKEKRCTSTSPLGLYGLVIERILPSPFTDIFRFIFALQCKCMAVTVDKRRQIDLGI
jgi:hypothetical protein